ncbi:hypothetical protein KSS87_021426 [Heliosperma pusillum]|nr:hypothetical protein KSS87_021426 [Heliosperma pusillum]
MMLCSSLRTRIQSWLRDYDELQSFAVFLLYVQIGFALVGSLGALYNGVSLVNLAIALFALVAIESGSQSLGRTYAFLLLSAICLDFIWFLLFSYDIWIALGFPSFIQVEGSSPLNVVMHSECNKLGQCSTQQDGIFSLVIGKSQIAKKRDDNRVGSEIKQLPITKAIAVCKQMYAEWPISVTLDAEFCFPPNMALIGRNVVNMAIWWCYPSYWILHISPEDYGTFFIFSLKLIFLMQILGLSVRISSSFLWIQMYRLGVSHVENAVSREVDFDLRNSFLAPATPAVVGQPSDSEDPLGGSIYDPAYYYSLFEVSQSDKLPHEGGNVDDMDGNSSSQADSCKLKLSLGNAFQAVMDDNAANLRQNV